MRIGFQRTHQAVRTRYKCVQHLKTVDIDLSTLFNGWFVLVVQHQIPTILTKNLILTQAILRHIYESPQDLTPYPVVQKLNRLEI